MNISEIVHGLGYRFWIKTVSDTGVDDVKHCLEIIKYLQGHLNNIIPASNEESWLKLYDTDDSLMDRDFTDALILSIGFKFWIKTVQLHKIDDLKHCSVTLSYLQAFIKDFPKQYQDEPLNKSKICTKSDEDMDMVNVKDEFIGHRIKFTKDVDEHGGNKENDDSNTGEMITFKQDFNEALADEHQKIESEVNHVVKSECKDDIDVDTETELMAKKKRLNFLLKGSSPTKKKLKYYDGTKPTHQRRVIVRCDYCGDEFPTVFTASLHIDIQHPDRKEEFDKKFKIYNCLRDYCGTSFYSTKALQKHRDRYHKDDRYGVSLHAVTNGERILKKHTCQECGKKIYNAEDFEDHLEEHKHGSKQFKCDICEQKFTYRSKLKTHLLKHAEEPDTSLCPHCGKEITSRTAMKKHIAKHQRSVKVDTNLKCELCEYVANTVGYMTKHMFDEHDHNAFFCDLCGKKCRGKNGITHHMDLIHSTEKQHVCDLCGKDFQCRVHLLRHKKTFHVDEKDKPHKCPHCGKGFDTKKILEGHINMHLGLKPHKCEFCGQGFQNASNMRAHIRKSCHKNH